MSLPIFWSPEAKESYYTIINYLEKNWSLREVNSFLNRVEEVLSLISHNPKLYTYHIEFNAFRCVITGQVSLFYRLKNNSVELLVFWDTRQDPDKFKTTL